MYFKPYIGLFFGLKALPWCHVEWGGMSLEEYDLKRIDLQFLNTKYNQIHLL